MANLKKGLEEIRKKPYETKIKILWVAVSIIAVIIIALWIVTVNFRSKPENQSPPLFKNLQENFKNIIKDSPFKN